VCSLFFIYKSTPTFLRSKFFLIAPNYPSSLSLTEFPLSPKALYLPSNTNAFTMQKHNYCAVKAVFLHSKSSPFGTHLK